MYRSTGVTSDTRGNFGHADLFYQNLIFMPNDMFLWYKFCFVWCKSVLTTCYIRFDRLHCSHLHHRYVWKHHVISRKRVLKIDLVLLKRMLRTNKTRWFLKLNMRNGLIMVFIHHRNKNKKFPELIKVVHFSVKNLTVRSYPVGYPVGFPFVWREKVLWIHLYWFVRASVSHK